MTKEIQTTIANGCCYQERRIQGIQVIAMAFNWREMDNYYSDTKLLVYETYELNGYHTHKVGKFMMLLFDYELYRSPFAIRVISKSKKTSAFDTLQSLN